MLESCVAALCNNVNDPENNISLPRFLNLPHRHHLHGHFEYVFLVISGRGRLQQNRILTFAKLRKKLRFIQIENLFRRSSLGEM